MHGNEIRVKFDAMNNNCNNNMDKTFFCSVKDEHGDVNYNKIKKFCDISDKLARNETRLIFLLKCRRNRVIPNFIFDKLKIFDSLKSQNGVQHIRKKILKLENNLSNKFLNLEIDCCHSQVQGSKKDKNLISNDFKNFLPQSKWSIFFNTQKKKWLTLKKKCSLVLAKKLNKLLNKTTTNINEINFDEKCIKNLTNCELPTEAKVILSFGPKFSLHNDTHNVDVPKLL